MMIIYYQKDNIILLIIDKFVIYFKEKECYNFPCKAELFFAVQITLKNVI